MAISKASSVVLTGSSLLSTNRIFLITATRPTASRRHLAEEVHDAEHEHDRGQDEQDHADDDRHEILRVLEQPDRAGYPARMFLLSAAFSATSATR
jgi:hypothetical protein